MNNRVAQRSPALLEVRELGPKRGEIIARWHRSATLCFHPVEVTVTNVLGNTIATAVVAKWENAIDPAAATDDENEIELSLIEDPLLPGPEPVAAKA